MVEFIASVVACPDCWLGRQARSDFLRDQFTLHLFALMLPFVASVVLAESVSWLGKTPPSREREASK